MDLTRRGCLAHLFGSLAAASLPACSSTPSKGINETVSSVLVTQDGKKLVVMTPQYHYIFDLPPTILNALRGDFHPSVDAAFQHFRVDSKGRVTGDVTLLVTDPHPAVVAAALAAGFARNGNVAYFATTLQGERFKAGNVQPTEQYRLNKSYVIPVSGSGDAGATPIGAVAGTLVIGAIVLYLVFHPTWPR